MHSKSDKPLRLFVNPFAIWTQLAFKTGEAMWASAHAVAVRENARRVAVIPTTDAPPKAQAPAVVPGRPSAERMLATAHAAALRNAKAGPIADASAPPRKAKATIRQPSKAATFKAKRAKLRSKVARKRGVRR